MDAVVKAGPRPAEVGMATADLLTRVARSAGGSLDHGCEVPGYLQLPDLAMTWQCLDCGRTWRLVADRRPPGSPLEFVWVRDPVQPARSRSEQGIGSA